MKKAVKTAGGDPGELYRQALHDRFLCRVFFEGNEHFVLKGGSGMLARVPDARTTKDLDFTTQKTCRCARSTRGDEAHSRYRPWRLVRIPSYQKRRVYG